MNDMAWPKIGEQARDHRPVGDRAFDQSHAGMAFRQRTAMAGGEIIENEHFVTGLEEALGQVRAEAARASGDENAHGALI